MTSINNDVAHERATSFKFCPYFLKRTSSGAPLLTKFCVGGQNKSHTRGRGANALQAAAARNILGAAW